MLKQFILPLVALITASSSIFAALPVYEPFADSTGSGGTAYAVGSVLPGQINAQGYTWFTVNTAGTGTAPTNFAGNLSYTGLPTSTGNSVMLANISTGKGARVSLQTNVTTGTFYASFLMKVTSTVGLTTTPVFFACFNNTAGDSATALSVGGSKVYMKSTAGGYLLGISKNSTTAADITFDPTVRTTSDTLLVVVRYTFGAAATASDCKMWVNPDPSTFGNSAEPGGAFASTTVAAQTDISALASWTFLQRSSTQPATSIIDEVRVGRTWSGVTGGPEIGVQPANRTSNAGTTATFTVVSGGAAPLSYQWMKNGTPLADGGNVSGATAAILSLSGVLAADVASYSCVVSNSYGSVTSSAATLTVTDPAITSNPSNLTLPPGATANFSVVAGGTPTVTYLWYFNGVAMTDGVSGTGSIISGATSANLAVSGIAMGDGGTYTCAVTNGLGSGLVSSGGVLTILDPAITSQPVNVTNNFGGSASFSVAAAGTGPFTYQWRVNGNDLVNGGNISGAAGATLTVNPVSYLDVGSYSVVVSNNLGNSVTSSVATLTVKDPIITGQPVAKTNVAGTTATFSVTASGSPTINYQWKRGSSNIVDGGIISGATTATLTLTGVAQADATSYTVVVSGGSSLQSVTSSAATLKVIDPPSFTSAPQSRTVQAGVDVTFAVAASGTAPLGYQWSLNGSPVAGATGTSYIVPSVTVGTQPVSVTVTNASGMPATASATLNATASNLRLYETNIIVLRAGEGSQALSGNGNSIFLDQYTTGGTYVNTVTIPDNGTNQMVQGGTSTVEGYLTRSADGRLLCFAGYDTNLTGGVSLSGSSALLIPRVIGTLNGLGDYSRPIKASKYGGTAFRCAATDGTNNFWAAGGTSGTIYFPVGLPSVDIQTGKANTRVVEIFNGELYLTTASTTGTPAPQGIYKFTGMPTVAQALTSAIVSTNTGNGDGMNDFAINPAGTILYFADDRAVAGIAGGVQRWDFDGTTWVNTYNLTSGLGATTRSLTVDWSGANPVVYATTSQTAQNKLMVVTDTGAGSVFTTIATAGPNQLFRGVKFGPVTDAPVSQPTITSTAVDGSNVILSGTGGTAGASYTVLTSTDVSQPLTSWLPIATNTFGAGGSFSFTNAIAPGQLFFVLRVQ